jgi:hypothetical protein
LSAPGYAICIVSPLPANGILRRLGRYLENLFIPNVSDLGFCKGISTCVLSFWLMSNEVISGLGAVFLDGLSLFGSTHFVPTVMSKLSDVRLILVS